MAGLEARGGRQQEQDDAKYSNNGVINTKVNLLKGVEC